MKNDVFEVKSSQDGSWGDLGSVLVAKRGRLGAPNRPQIGPKSRPKIDQIFDRFLIDFWSILGGSGGNSTRGPAAEAWATQVLYLR